jgi:hypothetical protein
MSKLQQIKANYGLSSDKAGDLKSNVYNWAIVAVILDKVADHIIGMQAGWIQTALLILFLAALSYISKLTVGNIPPANAEIINRKIEEMDAEELLRAGRE